MLFRMLQFESNIASLDKTSRHPNNNAEYIVKNIHVKCIKCNQYFHFDTEAACESIGNKYGRKRELFEFVANMLPIVIIKKYLEYHAFANQNENDNTHKNDMYYKLYEELLKNTQDEDNIQFGCGCKEVNKFIKSNKQSILHEPRRIPSGKLKETTLRCTALLILLIANHVDIIVEQGVSYYAKLLNQFRPSDIDASINDTADIPQVKTTAQYFVDTPQALAAPQYFVQEPIGKYCSLSQQTTLRQLSKRQKVHENETLLNQNQTAFTDYAYQVALKYVEYVYCTTRDKKTVPSFDIKYDSKLRKLKQFWLGYSEERTAILDPLWLETAVIDNVENIHIWSPEWVKFSKMQKCNKKVQITVGQKKYKSMCN